MSKLLCFFRMIFLCTAVLFSFTSTAGCQDVITCLGEGLVLKEAGKTDKAIKVFKKAIRLDRRFAEAYYQLGLCYLRKPGNPRALKQAADAIINARRLDWENSDYLYALIEVYTARQMYWKARRLIKKYIKTDSTDVLFRGKLAELYKLEAEFFRNRGDKNGKYIIYSRKMLAKSVMMNSKILAIDPHNRDALFRQGMIYLDSKMFLEFINIFSAIVRDHPGDKNGRLFLGLGYSEIGRHDKALVHYDLALKLMKDEERELMENIAILLPDHDFDAGPAGVSHSEDFKNRFWREKDPFFMTAVNERKLAHYGRVAEANLRFTIFKKDIPGWQTEQGKVWIKYGRPLHITEESLFDGELASLGNEGSKVEFCRSQKWYYKDFTFEFWASLFDRNNHFYFRKNDHNNYGNENMVDYRNLYYETMREKPDEYIFKPRGELVDFPADAVTFRGENGLTDVRFYYGMPVNKIQWDKKGLLAKGAVHHGLFVLDEEWNQLSGIIDTLELERSFSDGTLLSPDLLLMQKSIELSPGTYNFGIEIYDPGSGNAGTIRNKKQVENYNSENLQLSDILVTDNTFLTDPSLPLSRNNITVYANPSRTFCKEQPIVTYFEIYNLAFNENRGNTSLKLDYAIIPVKPQESALKEFLRSFIWRGKKTEGISISTEITGNSKDEVQLLNIEHSISAPGLYKLIIRVTDLVSGRVTEKSTQLRILKKFDYSAQN